MHTVTVTDTDQTPIVTTTSGMTAYVAGSTPVAVDGGIMVTDRDNTTQYSGTVTITSGFHTGDMLASGCDACATSICATDPYCCDTLWDDGCVTEVTTICGQTCAGASSSSSSGGPSYQGIAAERSTTLSPLSAEMGM